MRNIVTTTANTIERTPAVTAFLASARKYPILSEEEIVANINLAKQGNLAARHKVTNSYLLFMFSLCTKFAKGDEALGLVSLATIGVDKAIDSFDATLGYKFISYAVHYMRMEISDYFRTINPMIRTTNNAKIGSKANKAAERFYQQEMRMPSEDELIEMLESEYGIEIKDKRDVVSAKISSISEQVADDATAEEIGEFAEVSASTNDFVAVAEKEQNSRTAHLFLSTLSVRDASIMKMLFGLDEWEDNAQSEEAVAERYGLTSERVRQIKEASLKSLRSRKRAVLAAV